MKFKGRHRSGNVLQGQGNHHHRSSLLTFREGVLPLTKQPWLMARVQTKSSLPVFWVMGLGCGLLTHSPKKFMIKVREKLENLY